MNFSDETLMAYADGALDHSTRDALEHCMQADPALAARVQQFIALRQSGYRDQARALDGAQPARAGDAGHAGHAGRPGARPAPARPKVVQLDAVRAARRQPVASAAPALGLAAPRPWQHWAALAVAAALGGALAVAAVTGFHSETQFAAVNGNGTLRAHGKLDAALTGQLASTEQPPGSLRIGVSFVSRDGQYCRAFELGGAAGLACRAGAGWNIPILVEGQGAGGDYRPVGSALPEAVQAAIDARAVGPALDGKAEQAAAARAWSR